MIYIYIENIFMNSPVLEPSAIVVRSPMLVSIAQKKEVMRVQPISHWFTCRNTSIVNNQLTFSLKPFFL